MWSEISCSCCGKRRRFGTGNKFISIDIYRSLFAGWNSYGEVLYCPECSNTWHDRNSLDKPLNGVEWTIALIAEAIIKDLNAEVIRLRSEVTALGRSQR